MYRFIFVILLSSYCLFAQTAKIQLKGKVIDEVSSKGIEGCAVFVSEIMSGNNTDSTGAFELNLPPGHYTINFSRIGYKSLKLSLFLPKEIRDKIITVKLKSSILQKDEIIVTGEKMKTPFVQEIQSKDLTRIPSGFNDVLRGVTVLSGVATDNEFTSGYNVRGGNYTENLIYLNGYEIYRPFLLKQGTEENQTIINPDMTDKIEFYNGSFPAEFGDKMASALSVEYFKEQTDTMKIKMRGSLLNSGISLRKKSGDFNILLGLRYAYPGLFLDQLQTTGNYKPTYLDFQGQINYTIPNGGDLELFGLYAKNTYGLTPSQWNGNFQTGMLEIKGVRIDYTGSRGYSFYTSLGALRYKYKLSSSSLFSVSASWFRNNENETADLTDNYYYIPDAYNNPNQNLEYLKTRYENTDNHLTAEQVEINATFLTITGANNFTAGIFHRWRRVSDQINESLAEKGDSVLFETPVSNLSNTRYSADESGLFFMDSYKPNNLLEIKGGIRFMSERMTNEFLISPRFQATYIINENNKLFAGWGVYYQPPFYLERRNNNVPLISQKAVHYSAGWENKFKNSLSLRVEAYYKKLDNLIPYYTEGQKIIYTGTNSNEGYAYGLDAMVQGEIVSGIQSWIGYGYLNTKERPKTGGQYLPMLTDQNHTILVFLQDRIKKHSNWQVHTRFLFGSGIYYYNRKIVNDPVSGNSYMQVDFNQPLPLPFYFRVDMGCSTAFDMNNNRKLIVTAEVLNMFNQYNYASYDFIQVFKTIPYPIRIPETLSPRLFNIQLEYEL